MFVVLNKTDMKANELRIGNYVHHNERNHLSSHLDSYLTVCELTEKSITTFYHSCHGGIQVVRNKKDYQPIPLTEEWLLRFGFLKTHKNAEWTIDAFRVCKTYDEDFVYPDWDINYIALPYVHQLQNLFWALCGKELTIKEETK